MAVSADQSAWPAPAKLNLMLRILRRRADGYHCLQTVFQFIEREDLLSYQIRRDGRIRRMSELAGVEPAADLVVRAARLLQEYTGSRLGADILVEKRLPMGGGLGGGSSNGATTLVALNELWGTSLSVRELMSLGLTLGADVPVFVGGRAAWGEGVGEDLTPLELPSPWFLVLVPPCEVSTAAVFSADNLTRNSAPITISDFLAGDDRNDCLSVVRLRYPPVAEALDWLASVGRPRLTGTGACVFCTFATEERARAALDAAPVHYNAFVARGLNRSPLLDRLGAERVLGASPSG
jgi:4-diphosphocytidyl-2-C-methyl-D-erythritol kinase